MKMLDTCFLIHLHREWTKNQPGPAMRYLEQQRELEFVVSVITVLEFLEGYDNAADGQRFLDPFPCPAVTAEVARIASRIRRGLRQRGEMIGDFDIDLLPKGISERPSLWEPSARRDEGVDEHPQPTCPP